MSEYLHNLILTSAWVWIILSIAGFIFWPQVTEDMSDGWSWAWLGIFCFSVLFIGVGLYTYYN